jgi:hypothetical protein
MTSSARRRIDEGIPRPSVRAVLRLITSSNVMGSCHWRFARLGALGLARLGGPIPAFAGPRFRRA